MPELLAGTSLGTVNDPLRADFRNFLYVVFQHLRLPEPDEVQYDIAHYLQHGPRRLVIEAFRGVGKSLITSAFACWLLYCDPQLKILVLSASKDKSDEFANLTYSLIQEMEILAFLRPKGNQRDSKLTFDVAPAIASQTPSLRSKGITGQITGGRADVAILDDVEIPKNSATSNQRDHLAELVKEVGGAVIKTDDHVRLIYLGTPQTEESLYNRLPGRGYTIRVWPARYPSPELVGKYGGRLAPMLLNRLDRGEKKAGDILVPRFSEEVLLERLAEYGRSGFQLQFMLDTSLSDAERYPLKTSDLIVMDLDPKRAPQALTWGRDTPLELPNYGFEGDRFYAPLFADKEWAPYQGIILAIDPSGRGKDETGYAVIALLFSTLYVLDAGALPGGYEETTLKAIAKLAERWEVNKVVVEPNFGDGMFNALLKPVLASTYKAGLEETERSQQMKEQRIIDSLEPVMNMHRLVINRSIIEKDHKDQEARDSDSARDYSLFYQMTHMVKEKGALRRDDRLDALALGVHYWTEKMNQDRNKAKAKFQDQEWDREIKRINSRGLHFVTGGTTKKKVPTMF